MSPPLAVTGDAAPVFVLGAMYARSADIVMNVPALAAVAPDGPTHTIVGMLEFRSVTMLVIEVRAPPSVSSWTITAAA